VFDRDRRDRVKFLGWVWAVAALGLAGCGSQPGVETAPPAAAPPVAAPPVMGPAPVYAGRSPQVAEGRELWAHNDVEGAAAAFEQAVAADPADADAMVWLAEARRRQDRLPEAQRLALQALEIAPDHAFALAVLGDLHNPQFKTGPLADQQRCLDYYRAALAADPGDIGGLLGLCAWAIRQGDDAESGRLLDAMRAAGVWSEPIIALARWALESAPADAVLLVNGDQDAYPIWMLQHEGVRPDVKVCHLALLNLEDYRSLLVARGLAVDDPLPVPAEGMWYVSQRAVLKLWQDARAHDLARPVVYAYTVPMENLPPDMGGGRFLMGGVALPMAPGEEGWAVKPEACRRSLEHVPPAVMGLPASTPRERSPVREAGAGHLPVNVVAVIARAWMWAIAGEEREESIWWHDRLLEYEAVLGPFGAGEPWRERFEERQRKLVEGGDS
jgi:hypothetical protein